ncbi:hypothetical protein HID58_091796 [Brassica napus]|uniref:Hexosyltransferase n=1 Tax=Brassica napus TaxID=3708 RepID=A0ABQ7WYJ6_BRANA|nr:hypothetical protein HID58_091796 [Brassica napus]
MQSPRKLFHARPSLATRRSTALIVLTSLAIGIAGFTFGLAAILFPALRLTGRNCLTNAPPKTVRVVWDVAGNRNGAGGGDGRRHKVMGFVGIQTGFGSTGRRQALRKTWMPSDPEGLRRLAFFKAAYALYDAEFYVKADDDIYLRPDRLSLLLAKERSHSQTYLGCLKKGPVFTDPKLKWYEPLSHLLGKEYFLHAYGPIYALSSDVVASLVALKNNRQDLLAFDWSYKTGAGLCNPEKRMLELHNQESCSKSPTLPSDDE